MPAYSKMIAGTETNSLPIEARNDGKIVILLDPVASLPSPVLGAPGASGGRLPLGALSERLSLRRSSLLDLHC